MSECWFQYAGTYVRIAWVAHFAPDRRMAVLERSDAEDQPTHNAEAAAVLGELLRNEKDRDAVLKLLVELVRPAGAEPKVWLDWFQGGNHPFTPQLKAARHSQNSGREMSRSSDRLKTAERKLDRAKLQVVEAEAELERLRALDASIVLAKVSEHLTHILSPVFAMGPAWVIMRVLSSYISEEEAEQETLLASSKKQEAEYLKRLSEQRVIDARLAADVLDLWAGVTEFEQALRKSIMSVISDFAGRNDQAEALGSRSRPRSTRSHPHGEALKNALSVLDSYQQHGS